MLDQLNRSLNPEETFLEVVKKYILIPDSILELDRLVCVSTYCFPLSISCSALPVFYFMFNFYVFYYYFNFDTIFNMTQTTFFFYAFYPCFIHMFSFCASLFSCAKKVSKEVHG